MFDLQTALDERLAKLKKNEAISEQESDDQAVSKESILNAWKQAGILDKNGKMVDKVSI